MPEDQQQDEWTPAALANYDAAHARLVHALDQFTAGLRAAMPTRTEGPELVALRDHVDRALGDLDRASADLTGEFFDAISPVDDDDDEDDEVLVLPPVDPEDGAGLGVSVVWRFDLRVDRPSVISRGARALYEEAYPEMDPTELSAHTGEVGPALQAITELAGMEALMSAEGLTPLGGVRVFVATDDLLDGGDAIDALLDPERDGPVPWTREAGAFFLPTEGEIGITEGYDFG